jgi:16S rRNA (guanine966-N2)-methyltransferase|tara:strand:+ start:29 stop:589 length:561 start_codon:yes stop_codon:yes gene_type:complete
MRIISGKFKNKSINFVKNSATRPLKDSVKENIFNILEHSNLFNLKIEMSKVLDLYSGIGSFGIECISRGAKKVIFVEQDLVASNILKKNLTKLLITDHAIVIKNTIENFMHTTVKEKFNIFFLDPPFLDKEFIQNLNIIKKNKIYRNNHIVIIHRENKADDNLKHIINIIRVKQYGRSKIIFGVFN